MKKSNIIFIAGLLIFTAALGLLIYTAEKKSSRIIDYTLLAGEQAPAFNLSDRDGNTYSLESLKGKNVLLFFNEGLACYPACWDEMLALGTDQRFADNNTVVLSVVADSKESWDKAIDRMPDLKNAKVVFDPGAKAADDYQMLKAASSMHAGKPGHTYVLIDQNGVIRYAYDDVKMGKNADRILEEIKKLN